MPAIARRRRRAPVRLAIAAAGAGCLRRQRRPSPTPAPTALDRAPTDAARPGAAELGSRCPTVAPDRADGSGARAQIDVFAEDNPARRVAPAVSQRCVRSLRFAIGYDGLEPIGNVNAVTLRCRASTSTRWRPRRGPAREIGATDIEIGDRSVRTDGLVVDYRLTVEVDGASPTFTGRVFVAIMMARPQYVTVTCTAADPAPASTTPTRWPTG
jgi:hypothetical protein